MSRRDFPTAIQGTWTDLERRAWWLYENMPEGTDAHELAEAVLVMLGEHYRFSRPVLPASQRQPLAPADSEDRSVRGRTR